MNENLNLGINILISIISGTFSAGVILAIIFTFLFKHFKKSKEALLAKELKRDKEIEYLTLNIKQLNNQLQLTDTVIAQKLNSFNVDKEQVDNFVINAKAQKEALTDKEKTKATKFKI